MKTLTIFFDQGVIEVEARRGIEALEEQGWRVRQIVPIIKADRLLDEYNDRQIAASSTRALIVVFEAGEAEVSVSSYS